MGTRLLRSAAAGLAASAAAGWLALAPASLPGWASRLLPGLLPAGTPEARADAITYSESRRQFKVGVLLLESTVIPTRPGLGPENPDPFVFYIADSRTDIKPQNWELVNPLAPATVTADIFQRWSYNDADDTLDGRDPANPYTIGQKVTKNMAAYWEVSLSRTSDADLAKYDLLFITHHRTLGLSPAEREKLRRIVDAGAVVWIEDCGGMRVDPLAPFFLEELQFTGRDAGLGIGAAPNLSGPVVYQPTHPLLNSPFRLTYEEVSNLGDKNYGSYYIGATSGTGEILASPLRAPNPETLVNIVGNNFAKDGAGRAMPYIAAGAYGSGAVVITAGDSGCDINDYAGGSNVLGGNSGAFSGTNIQTAHTEDLKFLYNLITWGSANNTARRNGRRTGASPAAANGSLFNDFVVPATAGVNPLQSTVSPLIRQGIIYVSGVSGGNGFIAAYDASPLRDFDGDGNPDDGVPDLLAGVAYDEMWRVNIPGGQASAPVFANLRLDGVQRDVILVTGGDGAVVAVDALPVVGGRISNTGTLLSSNPFTPAGALSGALAPQPPVIFEDKVFAAQPDGRVRCISFNGGNTLQTLWVSSTAATSNLAPDLRLTGAPALAQTRLTSRGQGAGQQTTAENSNGTTTDIMMYVPTVGTVDPPQAQVYGYWLGTRNEVLRGNNAINSLGRGRTRVFSGNEESRQYFIARGAPFLVPRGRVYSATPTASAEENFARGIPNPTGVVQFLDSPVNGNFHSGEILVTIDGAPVNGNDPDLTRRVIVAVDYDVVYAPAGPSGGTPPPALTTALGARSTPTMQVQGVISTPTQPGASTPAVAPGDLVIFSANQAGQGGTPQRFGAVYAANEQESVNGGSRLRWKATLHSGTTDNSGAAVLRAVEVDGVPVAEAPVLRNRIEFNASWPQVDTGAPLTAGSAVAEALYDVQVYGAPVVSGEGLTYVLAQAQGQARPYTVLMAFRTNPDIVLTLPEAFDANRPVTLSQANLLEYDAANATAQTVSLPPFTSASATDGSIVAADANRGKITITNFAGGGAVQLSATQSFVVRYTPVGGTQERRVVLPPTQTSPDDVNTIGQTSDPNGAGGARQGGGGFTPLQWYYVLPGTPASSPSLIGDRVYFGMSSFGGTYMISVDANPGNNDPTVRPGSGEQVFNVTGTFSGQQVTNNHVRQKLLLTNFVAPLADPTGGEGKLVIAGGGAPVAGGTPSGGMRVLSENVTLITESKRLVEVDASGAAVWSVESTVTGGTAGGAPPIYDAQTGGPLVANPTGRGIAERKPLSKPQVARRLPGSEYLVADTGNNRVVRIDRGGRATFECAALNDPYKILDSGDPLTLSGPTDVLYYTAPTVSGDPAAITGREDHYIIADAGNGRIIEVVNYYDARNQIRTDIPNFNPSNPAAATVRGERVVVWSTRTSSQEGRGLRFQSLARYVAEETVNDVAFQPVPHLLAVVGNASTAGGNSPSLTDFTGGSVVEINYAPYSTPLYGRNGLVPGQWRTATGTQTPRDIEPRANGALRSAVGNIWIRDTAGAGGRLKRIVAPTYFERILLTFQGETQPREVFLICDANGAYATTLQPYTGGGAVEAQVFAAFWKFEQADYNAMNINTVGGATIPRLNPSGLMDADLVAALPRFSPSSMKRLGSGNYLITNSAVGSSRLFTSGQFVGEAFEVTPYVSGTTPITDVGVFNPNVTATGGQFAGFSAPALLRQNNLNRQQMGDRNNTGLTEQPLFSDRQ